MVRRSEEAVVNVPPRPYRTHLALIVAFAMVITFGDLAAAAPVGRGSGSGPIMSAREGRPFPAATVLQSPIEATLGNLLAATPLGASDTDGDGLPDPVERILGVDPELKDSDGDRLKDLAELEAGLDPRNPDSNDDGLPDNVEGERPAQFDGDGIPNAWDEDNDNDQVPDGLDLSPFARTAPAGVYTLNLQTSGGATYVDVQVRPNDPSHLTLGNGRWDWPFDPEGTVRELVDGAADEDVRVIPMLQLFASSGPDLDAVEAYGIAGIEPNPWRWDRGRPAPEPVDSWKVLVPLAPVLDDGVTVALTGRLFVPAGAGLNPAEMKLVWMVSGPFDKNSASGFVAGYTQQQRDSLAAQDAWPLPPGDELQLPGKENTSCVVDSTDEVTVPGAAYALEFHCAEPLADGVVFEVGDEISYPSGGTPVRAAIVQVPIEQGSTVIARYADTFVVTGLDGTEYRRVKTGMVYGDDAQDVIQAGLVLDYRYLRSQKSFAEATRLFRDLGLRSVRAVTPRSLDPDALPVDHLDRALAVAAESLLPHVLDRLPDDQVAPVLTVVEERSIVRGPIEWNEEGPLQGGTDLTLDLRDETYAATSKMMRLSWFDTSTREQWDDHETAVSVATVGDEYLAELDAWDVPAATIENLKLLTLMWVSGEVVLTEIGGEPVQHREPEAVRLMDEIGQDMALGMDGLALAIGLDATINNWRYISALSSKGITLTNLAKIRAGLRNVTCAMFANELPLKATRFSKALRGLKGIAFVGELLGLAQGLYSMYAIAQAYGFSTEGWARGIWSLDLYLTTTLVFLVLTELGVICAATAGVGCVAAGVIGAIAAAALGLVLAIDALFGLGWWEAIEDWWNSLMFGTDTPLVDLDLAFTDGPDIAFRDWDDNGFDVDDNWRIAAEFRVDRTNTVGRTTALHLDHSDPVLPRFLPSATCYLDSYGMKVCQPAPRCDVMSTGKTCYGRDANLYDSAWSYDLEWYPATMNDTTTYRTPCSTLIAGIPSGDEQACRITHEGLTWAEVQFWKPSHDFMFNVANDYDAVVAVEHDPSIGSTYVTYEASSGDPVGETFHVDVLPGSIDAFVGWPTIAAVDADRDGLADAEDAQPLDPDPDGDGLTDGFEGTIETSWWDPDSDGDGLDDRGEIRFGTDPTIQDSDGDGLLDGEEPAGWDITFIYNGQVFVSHVTSDPLLRNSDADRLDDGQERTHGFDPRASDSDGDGTKDSSSATDVGAIAVTAGTLLSGGAQSLVADDGRFLKVRSSSHATEEASFRASFSGVDNAATALEVTYRGKASMTCEQRISIWRWSDSRWVLLDGRAVGRSEMQAAYLSPPGPPANYVSGTGGVGDVRVQVRCSRTQREAFILSSDVLRLMAGWA